jgi:hypothetical protein
VTRPPMIEPAPRPARRDSRPVHRPARTANRAHPRRARLSNARVPGGPRSTSEQHRLGALTAPPPQPPGGDLAGWTVTPRSFGGHPQAPAASRWALRANTLPESAPTTTRPTWSATRTDHRTGMRRPARTSPSAAEVPRPELEEPPCPAQVLERPETSDPKDNGGEGSRRRSCGKVSFERDKQHIA